MGRPDRIVGLAIVSADGMIADWRGTQPDALMLEADQRFFHGVLDEATALVHGRQSGESGPNAARRRRLILTRRIAGLAPDSQSDNALLWNPGGAPLEAAWETLGLSGGVLTVIGGTEAFGLFLDLGYDVFHLSLAGHARLPGGSPVFPGIPPATPEQRLTGHGLEPDPIRILDAAAALSLTTWRRR